MCLCIQTHIHTQIELIKKKGEQMENRDYLSLKDKKSYYSIHQSMS